MGQSPIIVPSGKPSRISRRIQTIYDRQCAKYSHPVKAVGWLSEETQQKRFDTLASVGNLDRRTVLDIGCGVGGFYGYLTTRGIKPHYTGIDLSEKMIEVAKESYPGAAFLQADLFSLSASRPFDYVVSSGAFNIRIRWQWKYITTAISRMFSLASTAVAFNGLSSYTDENRKDPFFFYYDPLKLTSFCFTLTSGVKLVHHYLPNDFTLFLYKKM